VHVYGGLKGNVTTMRQRADQTELLVGGDGYPVAGRWPDVAQARHSLAHEYLSPARAGPWRRSRPAARTDRTPLTTNTQTMAYNCKADENCPVNARTDNTDTVLQR